MSKDNNKTTKSQATPENSNVPSDEFLEFYTKTNYWDEHKKNTDELSNIYSNSGNEKLARYGERTKVCSEFLTYANRFDLKSGELAKKLVNANFCRVRLCPVCQWRRTLMWQARFYDAIPVLQKQYPTYRFLFLTLTVKNCKVENLAETIQWMNKSFRKMLKFRGLESWQGWLKTTEVTRNEKTNEAHPHFHVLIMVKPSYFQKKYYITQLRYRKMWQKALKSDYCPNVNIKAVRDKKTKNKMDITSAVQETLKYAVKQDDLLADPDWLYTLTEQVFRKRFISSGGILKNILKEEKETEQDLLNEEVLEQIEEIENEEGSIVFKFNRDFKKYTKKQVYKLEDGILPDQYRRRLQNLEIEANKIRNEKINNKIADDVADVEIIDIAENEEWKALLL